MKVAYVFTQPHSASYKLGQMILPQLEGGGHGVAVVGMFFFDDNVYVLSKGDSIGERLSAIASREGMLLMACDMCSLARGLAEGNPKSYGEDDANNSNNLGCRPLNMIEGAQVGCFPDLYAALSGNGPDQVISL